MLMVVMLLLMLHVVLPMLGRWVRVWRPGGRLLVCVMREGRVRRHGSRRVHL